MPKKWEKENTLTPSFTVLDSSKEVLALSNNAQRLLSLLYRPAHAEAYTLLISGNQSLNGMRTMRRALLDGLHVLICVAENLCC